jgi:hypothetical protein
VMQKRENGALPLEVRPSPNKYVTGAGTRCSGPCFTSGTCCGEYTLCEVTADLAETSPATAPARRLEAIA